MIEDKESQLVVGSNEDSLAASLINFYCDNIEDSNKQGIVSNTGFETIITLIKNISFVSAWWVL